MSWLASIGIALVSAFGAGVLGLGIGLSCVRWYAISSFEGKSGYFVVAVILVAALIGLVTGLVVARIQAGSVGVALMNSGITLVGMAAVVTLFAWLLAPARDHLVGAASEPRSDESVDEDRDLEATPTPHTNLPAEDAPLSAWLDMLRYNGAPEIRSAVFAQLRTRPGLVDQLTSAIRGDDHSLAYSALSAFAELPADTLPSADALLASSGDDLIARMQAVVSVSAVDDPGYEAAAAVSLRWSGWLQAVRSRPEASRPAYVTQLQSMINLAASRPDSHALSSEVDTARRYLSAWSNPSSPPV